MELRQSLGFLVNKLARDMATALEQRIRSYEVTASQWAILAFLWEREGQAQVTIERAFGVEAATITGLVQRMLRQGLIERQVDPTDKRVQRIFLTQRGRSVYPMLVLHAHELNEQAMHDFSPEERAFFIRLLQRALDNLHTPATPS